jgi:hypothetical protein
MTKIDLSKTPFAAMLESSSSPSEAILELLQEKREKLRVSSEAAAENRRQRLALR